MRAPSWTERGIVLRAIMALGKFSIEQIKDLSGLKESTVNKILNSVQESLEQVDESASHEGGGQRIYYCVKSACLASLRLELASNLRSAVPIVSCVGAFGAGKTAALLLLDSSGSMQDDPAKHTAHRRHVKNNPSSPGLLVCLGGSGARLLTRMAEQLTITNAYVDRSTRGLMLDSRMYGPGDLFFASSASAPASPTTRPSVKASRAVRLLIDLDLEPEGPCVCSEYISSGAAGVAEAAAETMPESLDLYGLLARTVVAGGRYAKMEVSSHALAQGRVSGMRFHTAVFTNLTHDHLDFHGTMESYFAAKAKLFGEEFAPRFAVINVDDEYGQRIWTLGATSGLTYGLWRGTELRAEAIENTFSGALWKIAPASENAMHPFVQTITTAGSGAETKTLGVSGSNGKTTTCYLGSIWRGAGQDCRGVVANGRQEPFDTHNLSTTLASLYQCLLFDELRARRRSKISKEAAVLDNLVQLLWGQRSASCTRLTCGVLEFHFTMGNHFELRSLVAHTAQPPTLGVLSHDTAWAHRIGLEGGIPKNCCDLSGGISMSAVDRSSTCSTTEVRSAGVCALGRLKIPARYEDYLTGLSDTRTIGQAPSRPSTFTVCVSARRSTCDSAQLEGIWIKPDLLGWIQGSMGSWRIHVTTVNCHFCTPKSNDSLASTSRGQRRNEVAANSQSTGVIAAVARSPGTDSLGRREVSSHTVASSDDYSRGIAHRVQSPEVSPENFPFWSLSDRRTENLLAFRTVVQ